MSEHWWEEGAPVATSLGEVRLFRGRYANGGGIAILGFCADGQPFATLTVNLPEEAHLLSEGEFFVPFWEEHAEVARELLAGGRFVDTGRSVQVGYGCQARIWRLVPGVELPELL